MLASVMAPAGKPAKCCLTAGGNWDNPLSSRANGGSHPGITGSGKR